MSLKKELLHNFKFQEYTELQEDSWSINNPFQIVVSPTGSGKTIAFLIQIFQALENNLNRKVLILTPTRELALQIKEVVLESKFNCKAIALYGGNDFSREQNQLSEDFNIIIATPGRLLDHFDRSNLDETDFSFLVIDEYDKMLEIGFQNELSEIVAQNNSWKKITLNSATVIDDLPKFINNYNFLIRDYTAKNKPQIEKYIVQYPHEEKLETLRNLILSNPETKKIIFTTHRDRAQMVFDFLDSFDLPTSMFHGGMDQRERERELLKFEHSSTTLMVCTDLGARGIDIDDIEEVIHYQLPIQSKDLKNNANTHRNGRTGRMNKKGIVYYLLDEEMDAPDYLSDLSLFEPNPLTFEIKAKYKTLYLPLGKKDKIRKMDVVGFFCKTGGISNKELGKISLKDNMTYVSISTELANKVKEKVDNQKIKNKKVRVSWSR